ncbi:MAG: hypothetical protein IJ736_07235, partial [Firmicutes bacterium]|nr:hypothetical protein [Bacillota bacterium]
VNHNRWFGAFSLPSSSKFYTDDPNKPVDVFDKTVLVSFYITTDESSAGWALYDTSGISGSEEGTGSSSSSSESDDDDDDSDDDEEKKRIKVVEFDLDETSAGDMSIVGTH